MKMNRVLSLTRMPIVKNSNGFQIQQKKIIARRGLSSANNTNRNKLNVVDRFETAATNTFARGGLFLATTGATASVCIGVN
jgi:hypothetical protein